MHSAGCFHCYIHGTCAAIESLGRRRRERGGGGACPNRAFLGLQCRCWCGQDGRQHSLVELYRYGAKQVLCQAVPFEFVTLLQPGNLVPPSLSATRSSASFSACLALCVAWASQALWSNFRVVVFQILLLLSPDRPSVRRLVALWERHNNTNAHRCPPSHVPTVQPLLSKSFPILSQHVDGMCPPRQPAGRLQLSCCLVQSAAWGQATLQALVAQGICLTSHLP